ncbi:MAG: phosphoribosylamine--glycine ligase [Kistimonas sp.]|nr:phosphoribosylamine--glycine ligase [Kistimonas sp.]
MKVMIIGSGSREHALAWKVRQSPLVQEVFVAPGNGGTAQEEGISNIAIDAKDTDALVSFAQDSRIDLTLVGPEDPLVQGLVDRFRARGLTVFGPSQQAAQLEGSKNFAKAFMKRHGIPTAEYASFTQLDSAESWIREKGTPLVIKADGLAAGKGVVIARTEDEALGAVRDMLAGDVFGKAGSRVIIEEFLEGKEVSFIVMTDGKEVLPLASSQDHKARYDGGQGPNTGGMGACSPASALTPSLHEHIMQQIILPTVRGMEAEGHAYSGFLYVGLMIDSDSVPHVLEYNCRLGDPETQPILVRLESDIFELCLAGATGKLGGHECQWDPRPAVGVVMAAEGYPGAVKRGDPITGLDAVEDAKVFLGGTTLRDDQLVTNGGRVLCVTASGDSLQHAREKAYKAVGKIHWKGCCFRSDIGAANQQDN